MASLRLVDNELVSWPKGQARYHCWGYELVSHELAPIHGVSLLPVSSHIQGRDIHCEPLHPPWLVSWHFDKFLV